MSHEKMVHSNHKGMDHSKMDHTNHQGIDHSGHAASFKTKFFVSLILGIPIVMLSPMMGVNLPFQFEFAGSQWIVLILSSILFFYGGLPFLQGAKFELKAKSPAMMTLISLGISVAYIYSLYAFVQNEILLSDTHIMDFFWELATLIIIMLLGHWIEMNAVSNAGNALQRMAELLPSSATRINKDGSSEETSLVNVNIDDILLVKGGDKIPTDRIIVDGSTSVNEAMVTGESKVVKKDINDKVIGGSINGSGTIKLMVTGTGESGYLAQVMDLVSNAQKEKSKVESLSDSVAKYLFYIALFVGILAFIIWMILTSDSNIALERMVTVLIIACPHALGLAIPLVTARSTSIGAKNGLLIKNRQSLETAKKVDIILMDKTGTLTEGNFVVDHYKSFSKEYSNEQVLGLFAALEKNSNHPLALGILNKARELNVNIPSLSNVNNIPGIGLEGKLDNLNLKVVSLKYLDDKSIEYDKQLFKDLSSRGNSISFLVINDKSVGIVAQGDQIKPESITMIKELKKQGIRPVMLTGDNKQVATSVANHIGIDDVHAQLLPEDKEEIVRMYIEQGNVVMMVGDGVNDAPSLVRADIGVAIGAGTDVAIDSGDVILVKSNPSDILHFLNLAKKTSRKMVQNLWWGAGYNIIAIPLAAGVLASYGIILSPAIGAVFMSLSTIIVAINAMLLKID
ncbi:MAG: heavy metal translocating P-type ATPase [Erysipelotrichales bacterium]